MKKTIYIMLAAILGFLLSFLGHAAIESIYIMRAGKNGVVLTPYLFGSCFLPPWLSAGLSVLGLLGGIALGFWGWGRVYVRECKKFGKK